MEVLKAIAVRIIFGIVALWAVVEVFSWSESGRKDSVGIYLPYELFYHSDNNKTEATATRFEIHALPTSAFKTEGFSDCVIPLSKQRYQAFSKQMPHPDNTEVKYLLVSVYWDKLTRRPVCDTSYDNVTPIEQKKVSSYERANKETMLQLLMARP